MKRRIFLLSAFGFLVGCDETITIQIKPSRCPDDTCPETPPADCPYKAVPPMDLPVELRESNYGSGGSCVHASMVACLRWQNLHKLADWWRGRYSGGEGIGGLASKAEAAGLRFAYTRQGDSQFLEWCSRTRRGAVIFYYENHSIVFCGFVGNEAVVMDNNRVDRLTRIPKQDFIRRWRSYGGVALTPVYSPDPPRPWVG